MFEPTFEELLSRKEQLETELGIVQKEFIKAAEVKFKEWAKDLFAKYPALEFISWTQYTPYFNDGDPCYFRSSHTYYSLNSDEAEEINDEGFTEEELENVQKEISEFLGIFSDDDMESLFGDHCRVTVNARGVSVDEYNHD
jgi:hypothetical protein